MSFALCLKNQSSTTLRNLSLAQAAQLDGKAGIIQALFEEGGTLAHLGLGWPWSQEMAWDVNIWLK